MGVIVPTVRAFDPPPPAKTIPLKEMTFLHISETVDLRYTEKFRQIRSTQEDKRQGQDGAHARDEHNGVVTRCLASVTPHVVTQVIFLLFLPRNHFRLPDLLPGALRRSGRVCVWGGRGGRGC